MIDQSTQLAIFEASARRRDERRRFLKMAGGAAAAAGAMSLLAACDDNDDNGTSTPTPTPTPAPTPTPSPTPTPTPTPAASEPDALNFALNLEYLEAEFYSYAVFGRGLQTDMTGGTGTRGTTTGGRKVSFTDSVVAQYAAEIARDEVAHVAYLRKALGGSAVARPSLNISGDANGAFTAAARAAGVVPADGTFDPYASDENFLLGAFIFEDVGVTAYKGALQFLKTPAVIEAAAGIHAAESYHAGLIRTVLYGKGIATPSLIDTVQKISDARDSLDGSDDLDQGIVVDGKANIVPTDASGIAFQRTPGQVLNIVYLTSSAVVGGGFFPNGVNGVVNTSGANTPNPAG